jgi:FMN phosphatase YigB (HAD superfamily)
LIAVVGQSVIDRVRLPDQPWVERLGGAPIFAGQVLMAARVLASLVTRGATPELRRPLHTLGARVIEGPATRSCISEMVLFEDGSCVDSLSSFGEPFTPADVRGWMAPGLADARAVVCGAQCRGDFLPSTLAALAAGSRPLYLDAQGPLRAPRLGPVSLERALLPALLRHVTLLKLSEEEAQVALGGVNAAAARSLGVPVVVVTLGERGAVVLVDGHATPVSVEPVRHLADTVGAGDAFLALMAGTVTAGATPIDAARLACAGTAEMLRHRLPDAPPREPRSPVLPSPPPGTTARHAAVLFDFGGTLDADGLTWSERVFQLFHQDGAVTTREEFAPIFYAADDALVGAIPRTLSFGDTVLRLFRTVAKGLALRAPAHDVDGLAARFVEQSRARLVANASIVRRLAARYRLGLVSNFYGNLATVAEEAGLRAPFTTVVDSAVVGCRKPDPAIFHLALSDLGIAPEAALFVGDSLSRDMMGARGVGMPHVWLTPAAAAGSTGHASGGPCCPEDQVIHSLGELERLLP